jgi:two-component system cell cycle response regulator
MEEMSLTEDMEPSSIPNGLVLIAEDDPDYRSLLSRRASKMGLEVVEAKDGEQALDALNEHEFDVMVVDLYMPEHNGLEIINAARKLDPDIQALIMTGSASVETAVQALRAGVYDYLTKPLESMTTFELALSRALERRRLIMENKRLFDEVQRLAVTDPLTGLFNRHKLQDSLSIEMERSHRYQRPLSIIMVDMDDLKVINDSFGHSSGDAALKCVGVAIQRSVRKVDLATRFGGDEFVIVLPEADCQEARAVAERIAAEIDRADFGVCALSVSLGVAQWSPLYKSMEAFIDAVDNAMYQAKRSGSPSHRVVAVDPCL